MGFCKTFVMFVVLATVFTNCYSQLTFTPGWGKRSGGSGLPGVQSSLTSGSTAENCRTSVDSLMMIYRFIQAEAQQYLDCKKHDSGF